MEAGIKSNGRSRRVLPGSQTGSILIGLIVTMVAFAALSAAVVPLFSSSTVGQVSSAQALKAHYMAESGYRYAGSRYLHGGSSADRDNILENELHNRTFTFNNNGGAFSLKVEGYFYKYNNLTGTTLAGDAFGQIPVNLSTGGSGNLVISYNNDSTFEPATYSSVTSPDETGITFTLSSTPGSSGPSGETRIYPASLASSVPSTGSLQLQAGEGQALFPSKYATFRVLDSTTGEPKFNGDLFSYRALAGDTLTGIVNIVDPTDVITSTDITSGDIIALQRFVRLTSTGTFGGTGSMAASRRLVYSVPLEAVSGGGGFGGAPETEVDLSELAANNPLEHGNSLGQFDVVDLGGDDALDVTSTTGGSGKGNQPRVEAMIGEDGSSPNNPFYKSWNNTGHFLSYDAQVKIGMGTWSGGGFTDKPYYFLAGISTRLGGTTAGAVTSYGVSFMRSRTGTGNSSDGIPDTLVPGGQEDTPLVVLWDRNGRSTNSGDFWLAYMTLNTSGHVLEEVTEEVCTGHGKWATCEDVTSTYLKDWSTILVRMVEAASIEYSGSSAIEAGDIVTTAGGASAEVIKKIGVGSNEVLLLNNVEGSFSAGQSVGNGTAFVTIGTWRDKDNYIWAFYGDTSSHGTANAVAVDTSRGNNQRGGTFNWLPDRIGNWSSSYDHFTLVQWSGTLNTGVDSSLRRMGTGKESNGIIRTGLWLSPVSTYEYEPEVGLHALGGSASTVYFDDFGYYTPDAGAGSVVPVGFVNAVVQE